MNYIEIENKYLTYLKLFDGITVNAPENSVACDVSFNDFITARHLADKNCFRRVYAISGKEIVNNDKITTISYQYNLAYSLSRIKCDFLLSLGGIYNFQPMYDVVHAIHKCLNVGGKFVFVVYPEIFDDAGRDVLHGLSISSEIPVKEKLKRWFAALQNSLSHVFTNIRTESIMQDVSFDEIKDLFASANFKKYIFKNDNEYKRFFHPLNKSERKYCLSWNVLKGTKL